MSDNTINIVRDSKRKTSSALRICTSLDSHLPDLNHDRLEPEVIPLSNDSDLERVFGNSLEEGYFFLTH